MNNKIQKFIMSCHIFKGSILRVCSLDSKATRSKCNESNKT